MRGTDALNHQPRQFTFGLKTDGLGNARLATALLIVDPPLGKIELAVDEGMTFRGHVVDIGPRAVTVEVTGNADKIKAFIDLVRPLGIKEIVRSGKIAMVRAVQHETNNRAAVRDAS